MSKIFYISLSVVFLLVSCQNNSQSLIDVNKNNQTIKQVEDKFFYIEFINLDRKNTYRNIVEELKKELYNNGYINSKKSDNDWQGIRKVNIAEHINLQDIDKYHPNIHKFRDFSEYDSSSEDIEKIVITLNKPINDSIPNFNFRSYKKRGHEEWQSIFNPGNFRYMEKQTFNESEMTNWMIKTIVSLTFK